jgi:CRISPR-associated protein Cmr5
MSGTKPTSTGIEQGRASQAYKFVKQAIDDPKVSWDNYKSGVRKLPAYIKTNGLGQTLAFIKNRDNFPRIYEQLTEWLQRENEEGLEQKGDLVQQVIAMPSARYRQVTMETLALINWMRRFVDGLDEKDKNNKESA